MKPTTSDLGSLGEELVAQWLQSQNWSILHRRWRCRWGEIDLIAQQLTSQACQSKRTTETYLAFVEVKTRSLDNWDADGLLAITPQKQAKLWKAAQMFLADHVDLASLPCRFDVALVCCQGSQSREELQSPGTGRSQMPVSPLLGQPVQLGKHQLTLQDYIESAFSG